MRKWKRSITYYLLAAFDSDHDYWIVFLGIGDELVGSGEASGDVYLSGRTAHHMISTVTLVVIT